MSELVIEIPAALKKETGKIKKEVAELISLEEKRKLLSLFIDEVMKGAKNLSKDEIIRLGRNIKKGRFEKLKHAGLV